MSDKHGFTADDERPAEVHEKDAPVRAADPAGPEGSGISGVPLEPTDSALHRLQEQLDESRDRHLRLAAEFDNFRKRVARERIELTDRAQAAFVMKMLEVLDDLDRLVAQESSAISADALHDALVMIDRKLRKELEAAGLEPIDPAGEPFDPGQHEAVAVTPTSEAGQDNLVSATFQTGYRFKGSLIRPARVQVYSSDQGA